MRRLKMTLIIFGAVFLFMGLRDIYYDSQTPANYNEMLESDFQKGMIVEGDLYANLGCFEENYTTRNGVKTGSSKYNYMIPVGETQYMGLLNNTTTMETQLNNQADLTFDYMEGVYVTQPEPVHFKGRVIQMDEETKGYMCDYMIYLGFTTQEVDSYILPYYIKCENYESGGIYALIGFVVLALGLLLVIAPIVNARKKQNVLFAHEGNVQSGYGSVVMEDNFDTFQSNGVETTSYENTTNESSFDEWNTTSNVTSTEGLGEGIIDEKPKSDLRLKLKV